MDVGLSQRVQSAMVCKIMVAAPSWLALLLSSGMSMDRSSGGGVVLDIDAIGVGALALVTWCFLWGASHLGGGKDDFMM